jgi:hypothetical protein
MRGAVWSRALVPYVRPLRTISVHHFTTTVPIFFGLAKRRSQQPQEFRRFCLACFAPTVSDEACAVRGTLGGTAGFSCVHYPSRLVPSNNACRAISPLFGFFERRSIAGAWRVTGAPSLRNARVTARGMSERASRSYAQAFLSTLHTAVSRASVSGHPRAREAPCACHCPAHRRGGARALIEFVCRRTPHASFHRGMFPFRRALLPLLAFPQPAAPAASRCAPPVPSRPVPSLSGPRPFRVRPLDWTGDSRQGVHSERSAVDHTGVCCTRLGALLTRLPRPPSPFRSVH